ncbi:MAG: hypothetical protein AMXMBFR84_39690 [Candidatus Hydrogenedentota bacterium]
MISWAILYGVCTTATAANALVNAGFESIAGDKPAQWLVYVEPMDGAEYAVDTDVHRSGGASIRLHNPRLYAEEPANNWSQNILRNYSGKKVKLTAYIKADNATEAAVWIQAFRKSPLRLLLQASSSDTVHMGGTQDWTEVAVETTIPAGSDFLVVRCVLKGEGTAWFDDLQLEVEQPPSTPPVDAAENDDTIVTEKPVTDASTIQDPGSNIAQDKAALEAIQSMREAGESIQESNRAIMEEIRHMREEMQALQNELDAKQAELKELQDAAKPPAPPLVPRLDQERRRP